jgi:cell wall-associated NlpC family hydrolase
MKTNFFLFLISFSLLAASCGSSKKATSEPKKSSTTKTTNTKTTSTKPSGSAKVFTKMLAIDRNEFVAYAKTFKGVPYIYGGTDAKKGLDCSGFILNVFAKFNVKAPRVTRDYANEGKSISITSAKTGDIILFTGSNHASGIIGHMGIVTKNEKGVIEFIHSASGKNIGVIESKFTGYWKEHYVKTIQLLE